ncbi:MAG TPA: 7-cyano-7-deazaguanine synthase [Nitrososphaerales archaeon]|nr:7-cyano-7-deazaguanine synthase [Nitrososphaerales archaeon]
MLLSGGIDSATALYLVRSKYRARALTFEYHGIAKREVDSSRAIAARAGAVEHRLVRLPDLKEASDIPGAVFKGLPPTYIPLRNAIFYSFAAAYAEEAGASAIVGGHNRDDAAVFLDVGTEFFSHLQAAFLSGSARLRQNGLRIIRPLKHRRKASVLKLAKSLGVPLELTWSCHRDGASHCWRCPGCLSRRQAFSRAGVNDPLEESPRKIT